MRLTCIGVLGFLLLPILVIMPLSFSDSSFLVYPIPAWSLKWYHNLFSSAEWGPRREEQLHRRADRHRDRDRARHDGRRRPGARAVPLQRLLMSLLIAPMVVPIVVVGVGTYLFFANIGLGDTYTALILVHAALGAPFVLTTVLATLQGFNHNLVRASLSLGASPLESFFRITLPVIAPGVISGALFAFATSFDEVVVALFLAGPEQMTLPRQMFNGIRENISPTIAAVATLLILFTTSLLLALEWLRGRRR